MQHELEMQLAFSQHGAPTQPPSKALSPLEHDLYTAMCEYCRRQQRRRKPDLVSSGEGHSRVDLRKMLEAPRVRGCMQSALSPGKDFGAWVSESLFDKAPQVRNMER